MTPSGAWPTQRDPSNRNRLWKSETPHTATYHDESNSLVCGEQGAQTAHDTLIDSSHQQSESPSGGAATSDHRSPNAPNGKSCAVGRDFRLNKQSVPSGFLFGSRGNGAGAGKAQRGCRSRPPPVRAAAGPGAHSSYLAQRNPLQIHVHVKKKGKRHLSRPSPEPPGDPGLRPPLPEGANQGSVVFWCAPRFTLAPPDQWH